MRSLKFTLLATAMIATAGTAHATDYLTGYAGFFNLFEHQGVDTAGLFGAEYRAEAWDYGIRPTLGISVDSDGDVYGYTGIHWDIKLSDPWTLSPNFMVGLYNHASGGEDLGGAIEFRSGLEVSYTLANQQRLGVAFNHMSNASIYDDNPGAENLIFTYSLPLGGWFK